jgi:hypothetical protein
VNRRGSLFWVGLVVVLVAVGYLFGERTSSGEPLDPDGTDGLGTRALMLFLSEYGVTVERDGAMPEPGSTEVDVALVLTDQLDDQAWNDLADWVETGGTVVQIGATSPLGPNGPPRFSTVESLPSGQCDLPGLDGLVLEGPSFQLLPTTGADASCFGDDEHALVHVADLGAGRVVSLGTAVVLTNEYLDQGDNAVLAAALLVPDRSSGPGAEAGTVTVYALPQLTPGTKDVWHLLPTAARWAGVQLLVAFVLHAWWQGRRFGRPVDEPQPVELPGSLLVRASAELLRRSRSHERAGEVLRGHTIRRVRAHLAAPSDTPAAVLVEELVSRVGVERATAQRVLLGPPVAEVSALAALVADIDEIGTALGDIHPVGDGPIAVDVVEPIGSDPTGGFTGEPSHDEPYAPTGAAT